MKMIHTKKEALEKIKKTIPILKIIEEDLNDIGNCWESLDANDLERHICKKYSLILSEISIHLQKIN